MSDQAPAVPPFDAAYARAREIARYPGNHVRTCDGEELIGRPHYGGRGEPLRDPSTGRVIWEVRPRAGFDLLADGSWRPVPFLAPLLQVSQVSRDNFVGMRVTPEVRVERLESFTILVRTLTVEVNFLTEDRLKKRGILEIGEKLQPIVRTFFPLHESVVREHVTSDVVVAELPYQPILYRFRGRHEDPNRPLGVPGEPLALKG